MKEKNAVMCLTGLLLFAPPATASNHVNTLEDSPLSCTSISMADSAIDHIQNIIDRVASNSVSRPCNRSKASNGSHIEMDSTYSKEQQLDSSYRAGARKNAQHRSIDDLMQTSAEQGLSANQQDDSEITNSKINQIPKLPGYINVH